MKQTILVICSVLLFVCALASVVGAGVYSYFQPRLYSSATEFQLLFPTDDGQRLPSAFQQAQQQYPTRMNQPLTGRVSLRRTDAADHFRITALDVDPQTAANTANILTISIMDSFRGSADNQRVKVLQKGEPAMTPSFPNVQQILMFGVSAAALCGAAGVVLLIIAFARRNSDAAPT